MAPRLINGTEIGSEIEGRLTPDAVALYAYAVAHPDWTTDDVSESLGLDRKRRADAVEVLAKLKLFRRSVDPSRLWDALSPDCALAELVADEETDLCRRQAYVGKIRGELSSLGPAYFAARRIRHGAEAVDIVHDVRTLWRLLTDWSRRVATEVCIAHPGGGMTEAGLVRSLERDVAVLRRGVRIRTVLQHSVRHHAPTRQYVTTVSPLGAQIRTVPAVPRRLILFDRDIAVVPLEGGRPESGAAVVREPAMIDYLFSTFELLWTLGRPFATENSEHPYSDVGRDELSRAILGYLAAGAKDDAIAHRLGLSVRTCRRHIAALMEHLGANSRFEAGILAQRRGLLDQPLGGDTNGVDREP
jgi:DNA-binding CsgD family transcriptional regulator